MDDKKKIYYEYFYENIVPKVQDLEHYRRHLLLKIIILSLAFFVIGLVFAWIFILIMLDGKFHPILYSVILFIMYAFLIKSIITIVLADKEYQQKFINDFIPLLMPPVANFKNWPKNSNTAAILDSTLFPNFDTQEDVSAVFGYYNNTNILISDTRLTLPVRALDKPNLFKGALIQLELPKSINNHIVIISKKERKFNHYTQFNPHVDEFNTYLYAFAKNTRNLEIVNRDFWSVIKKMGEVYTAKGFGFSYKNNTVLIALRQKRLIQFGMIFRSLLNPKNYDALIERYIVIYDLIDILTKN